MSHFSITKVAAVNLYISFFFFLNLYVSAGEIPKPELLSQKVANYNPHDCCLQHLYQLF